MNEICTELDEGVPPGLGQRRQNQRSGARWS